MKSFEETGDLQDFALMLANLKFVNAMQNTLFHLLAEFILRDKDDKDTDYHYNDIC